VTERVFVIPPGSQIGPITPEQRRVLIANSLVAGVYEKTVDRESAYEKIKGRAVAGADAAQTQPKAGKAGAPEADDGIMGGLNDVLFGSTGPRGGKRDGIVQTLGKSAARTIGSSVGREIIRGVLGGLFGGKRR
jgi:hypothetical protein